MPHLSYFLPAFFVYFLSPLQCYLPMSSRQLLHTPYFFFEHQQTIGNHIGNWHLVTTFNLTQIMEKVTSLKIIEAEIQNIEKILKVTKHEGRFDLQLSLINDLYDTIKTTIENTRTRRKRGLFNAVSYVQKLLFGTPDASDAEYYDKTLRRLSADDSTTKYLLERQIQLINNTVNNFENNNKIFTKNQEKIQKFLKELSTLVNAAHSAISDNHIRQHISSLADIFSQVSDQVIFELSTLQNAVLFAKRDILHPQVFTLTKLRYLISQVKLPSDQRFPLDNSITNVERYTDISNTHTSLIDDKYILFTISIPIIENTKYSLYHLLPLPFSDPVQPHVLHYINPSSPYLVVSWPLIRYQFLNDLSMC